MRVEIEPSPFPLFNRGINVTSETTEEKEFLERLWGQGVATAVFSRKDDGNVALTIAPVPVKEDGEADGS